MYIVGNRNFPSKSEAIQYCISCDFDPETMIQEEMDKNKMVDGIALATIIKKAFDDTFEQIVVEKTNRMLTLNQYIEKNKKEYTEIFVSEDLATMELKKEYYEKIIEWIKKGNKISKKAYDSLPNDLQFHFNKHYNYRGDKLAC